MFASPCHDLNRKASSHRSHAHVAATKHQPCQCASCAGERKAFRPPIGNQAMLQRLAAHKNTSADAGAQPAAPVQPQPAAPVAPPQAKPACPAGQEVGTLRGCIKPVVIADNDGKNPTSATSIAKAQEIWKKCCIDLSPDSTVTVNKESYKTLDESEDNTPTQEESDLFKAVAESGCIQVFQPAKLKMGTDEGKDVNGGGGTYFGGSAHPKIVLVEGALPEVLAHEVGHALGFHGHPAAAAGTVMEATNHYNVANPTTVSADVCTSARSGSALSEPGATCCETIP